MDKSKIFLDLSKCSEEERKYVFSLLPEPKYSNQYTIDFGSTYKLSLFDGIWWVFNRTYNRTEVTYPEFIKLFEGGESKEVLQVDNNGWIKIESEADLPKEVDQYWFASHNNKIEIRFYNPNWIDDRVQFRRRYTHYQPIIKPLSPKF